MYYLSACKRGLFKSYYCYVLFLSFGKSFKYYEKQFLIQSPYTLEKSVNTATIMISVDGKRTVFPVKLKLQGKGSNSPDLSGRLPILRSLSRSPDFTTILPINEIVTYHFLVFCSFVEIF